MTEPDDGPEEINELRWQLYMSSTWRTAIAQAEQRYAHHQPNGGYTSNDVMASAWDNLSAEDQAKTFPDLLNCAWHHMQHVKQLSEMEAKAYEDGASFLEPGDIEAFELAHFEARDEGHGPVAWLPAEWLKRLTDELHLQRTIIDRLKRKEG